MSDRNIPTDLVTRPYKVVTEVEAHACPSCHQDAPGHIVVGPDYIGFGATYYGDDGKDEADDLADMLNDAYEVGRTSLTEAVTLLKQYDGLISAAEWESRRNALLAALDVTEKNNGT